MGEQFSYWVKKRLPFKEALTKRKNVTLDILKYVIKFQVIVLPGAGDGAHLTPVTGHAVVDRLGLGLLSLSSGSRDGGLPSLLEGEVELVEGPRHLRQGNEQLLVIGYCHLQTR